VSERLKNSPMNGGEEEEEEEEEEILKMKVNKCTGLNDAEPM